MLHHTPAQTGLVHFGGEALNQGSTATASANYTACAEVLPHGAAGPLNKTAPKPSQAQGLPRDALVLDGSVRPVHRLPEVVAGVVALLPTRTLWANSDEISPHSTCPYVSSAGEYANAS